MECSILYKARMGLCVLALALSTTLAASQEEVSQDTVSLVQDPSSQEEVSQESTSLVQDSSSQEEVSQEPISLVQDSPSQKDIDADAEELTEVEDNQEDLNPENIIEDQICTDNTIGIVPEWLVKEKIIPNLVLQSEELWSSNALFLKDALEGLVFSPKGNEIEVISDRLLDNSKQISQLIGKNSRSKSGRIEELLNEQNFTLYSYVLALKFNSSDLPEIEALLEKLNRELIEAITSGLRKNDKYRKRLNKAFEERLRVLKEESKGFVHAEKSEPNDFSAAYVAFNRSLLAGQDVGTAIGWKLFYKKH